MGLQYKRLGKYTLILILFCIFIANSSAANAPIIDGTSHKAKSQGIYIVRRGDTLYSIAFGHGMDYRRLARINGIRAPYGLHPGQRLVINTRLARKSRANYRSRVRKSKPKYVAKKTTHTQKWRPKEKTKYAQRKYTANHKVKKRSPKKIHKTRAKPRYREIKLPSHIEKWRWPAKGKIIARYSPWKGNKGINIAGRRGSPIYATAAGIVVYRGMGINGYGKLLIIKHNSRYLSAYAHNQVILVKEGQYVKAGQKVALMGKTGSKRVMLHFEIRRYGKPVNPLKYLPTR